MIIFIAALIIAAIFLLIDRVFGDISIKLGRVVGKYQPKIDNTSNLFWGVINTKYAVTIKADFDEIIYIPVDYSIWCRCDAQDRCKIAVVKGYFTGIVWDIQIVGKTY